jgi:hypothetical protein
MTALITNVNNPKESILMGSVRINAMGRKKAFNIPNIAAALTADMKPLTCMPSSMYEANNMAPVNVNQRSAIPRIYILLGFGFQSTINTITGKPLLR